MHVRFDNVGSTLVPAVGIADGSLFVTTPQNDFVPAPSSFGIRLDAPGDRVVYAESLEGAARAPNIAFHRGSADLCFLPGAPDAHPDILFLLDSRGFSLRRVDAAPPELVVTLRGLEGAVLAEAIADASPLDRESWLRLTVTWDRDAAEGQPNVRVFYDAVEASYTSQPTGPLPGLPPSPDGRLRVGAGAEPTSSSNGVFDELRIHDDLILP